MLPLTAFWETNPARAPCFPFFKDLHRYAGFGLNRSGRWVSHFWLARVDIPDTAAVTPPSPFSTAYFL
jgi:hypothetical protein